MSENEQKVHITNKGIPFWVIGWLFTIGALVATEPPDAVAFKVIFVELVIWPFHLGYMIFSRL